LQNMLDKVLPFGHVNPVLVNVSGYQLEPFISICDKVYSDIVGVPFPHKWNENLLPLFYSNSLQQDYALLNPDNTSVTNVEWLERGIVVEMTSPQSPKAWGYVECGRELTQATGTLEQPGNWQGPTFVCNSLPNNQLYYGTWGGTDSDATFGNNPGANSVYTSPIGTNGTAQNPITQIRDTNGNPQVVTTYGTCRSTQPVWPAANSAAGTQTTDGTTVWTIVDPNGTGIRILPVPSTTGVVYQFRLVAQKPAIRFSALSQTFDPFPDKYYQYFLQGIITQCFRYSTDPKIRNQFKDEYVNWKMTLNDLRAAQDRELEENTFVPDRTIMGVGGRRGGSWLGAAWPFNYPRL